MLPAALRLICPGVSPTVCPGGTLRSIRGLGWCAGGFGLNGCEGDVALIGLDVRSGHVDQAGEPREGQCDHEDRHTREIRLCEGYYDGG